MESERRMNGPLSGDVEIKIQMKFRVEMDGVPCHTQLIWAQRNYRNNPGVMVPLTKVTDQVCGYQDRE